MKHQIIELFPASTRQATSSHMYRDPSLVLRYPSIQQGIVNVLKWGLYGHMGSYLTWAGMELQKHLWRPKECVGMVPNVKWLDG